MFPQSELENYKLQVQLLQEKLERSEERRQQAEAKFENIMKKRREHERLMRAKRRLKNQEFLQEKAERNERNRSLVRALERIDQQATSLAARSENLKILKVQYELYFNQVLQFRTMPNAHFNHNCYYPPMIPMACNLSHSAHFDSPNLRRAFTLPTFDVGNFESMPELDSYRHADNAIPQDTLVCTPGVASQRLQQREVNLQPNVRDLIAPTTGISSPDPRNQSALFADTRISIDSSRYKAEDPKAIESHFDSKDVEATRMGGARSQSDRPQSLQQENSNEAQGPTRSYGGSDNLKRDSVAPPQGNETYLSSKRSFTQDVESQPFMLDKLHPINRDEALGKLLAKLYDNGMKNDGDEYEKAGEKSLPRCAMEGKNMPVIKGEIMDPMESQLTSAQIAEKVTDSNMSDGKDTATTLNHNGRVDKFRADYVPMIKKKEKLSIETIENAIYGERITPASSITDRTINLEKLEDAFTGSLKIDSNEGSAEMSSPEERSDMNMKAKNAFPEYEANPLLKNESEVDVEIYKKNSAEEDTTQEVAEKYFESPISHDNSKPLTSNYEGEANEFDNYTNSLKYQNEPEKYSDHPQYEHQPEEQTYQDYSYAQNQGQLQDYDSSQMPEQAYYQNENNYEQMGDANYDQSQEMQQYPQYADPSYSMNQGQYGHYDQSYANPYPDAEYSENQQQQGSPNQQQLSHLDEIQFSYDQQSTGENVYDPGSQGYADSQQEQQSYQETPQEFYHYPEQDQYVENEYNNQQLEYSTDTEHADNPAPMFSSEPLDSPQITEEININAQPYQTEEANPNSISPGPESLSQEMPAGSERAESVKPVSILSTNEKPNEPSPNGSKNKKKKRVIFAAKDATDENATKPTISGKPISTVSRIGSNGNNAAASK